MSAGARHTIASRIKSERGASFSIALLLIIVCVVLSSVILAASTASTGWMAKRGQADQRYYSVVSAAQLFQDSLGDGGAKFEYVLEREGTRTEGKSDLSFGSVKVASEPVTPTNAKALNYLPDLTCYGLFGLKAENVHKDATFTTDWPVAFGGSAYLPIEYTVAPSNDVHGDNSSAADLLVKAKGRLWNDWTLELEFCNSNATGGSNPDYFRLYMVLEGEFDEDFDKTETLVSGSNPDSEAKYKVTEKRTTSVTWRLKQIVPGRGLDDA